MERWVIQVSELIFKCKKCDCESPIVRSNDWQVIFECSDCSYTVVISNDVFYNPTICDHCESLITTFEQIESDVELCICSSCGNQFARSVDIEQ